MTGRPAYFEAIRQKASQRWDQLEKDPELAGPWHQLFKQVQSPRHILSELLQNAAAPGETDAAARGSPCRKRNCASSMPRAGLCWAGGSGAVCWPGGPR